MKLNGRRLTLLLAFVLFAAGMGFAQTAGDGEAGSAEAAAPQTGAGGGAAEPEKPPVPAVAATTGTLGLFTLETGELLPRHGWSLAGYANRLTRMPGSVWIFETGVDVGYGLTNRLSVYADFTPYGHTHTDAPNELRSFSLTNRSGYVEDYPYAGMDSGGPGEATLGVKFAILSEGRGAPVSLSIRNDFIVPTANATRDLFTDGTQSGEFNDQLALALSKRWGKVITVAVDGAYRFTRDPRSGGAVVLTQADQVRVGAGYIVLPQSRVQFIAEYSGIIFVGAATGNNTFGARDPVESVSGVRLYPWRSFAIDVGYRYMLNLKQADDRDGFIVKLGWTHLPARSSEAVNHSPVAACWADKKSVAAGSNDAIAIMTRAADPDGDPVQYSWAATGGRVEGTGSQVRWFAGSAAPGNYAVTVTVSDGRGGSTTCSVNPSVTP
jgi:hypothetical protein